MANNKQRANAHNKEKGCCAPTTASFCVRARQLATFIGSWQGSSAPCQNYAKLGMPLTGPRSTVSAGRSSLLVKIGKLTSKVSFADFLIGFLSMQNWPAGLLRPLLLFLEFCRLRRWAARPIPTQASSAQPRAQATWGRLVEPSCFGFLVCQKAPEGGFECRAVLEVLGWFLFCRKSIYECFILQGSCGNV